LLLAREVLTYQGMAEKKLTEYRKKRDFSRTGEPAGGTTEPHKLPRFVIQKHDARSLHYDFRLEIDGVLKSWAVPKGPSNDPRVKRLAVPTEDHPLEYADFEGVIPEPEYGAGTVMVWDFGTYKNLRSISMEDSLAQGKLEVRLAGRKLKGAFVLVRTGFGMKKPGWLLKKMADEYAGTTEPVDVGPDSAKTGRTLDLIGRSKT